MRLIPRRFLSWLLFLANAHARSSYYRAEVYAMKDLILRRYGKLQKTQDVQRIVDPCWSCHGTGGMRPPFPVGMKCPDCRGTAVYRTRWVALERWTLAGRTFHRPIGPTIPRAVDYIDGLITHGGVSEHASREATLWLALLFDRALFRSLLRFPIEHRSRLPLLTVQRALARIRRTEAYRRRQHENELRRRETQLATAPVPNNDDDDLPF